MDQSTFWKIIDASREEADGNPEVHIDALQEQLMQLPAEEIVTFYRIFSEYHERAYRWDLWGAAYVIGGGCSDDGFMDFRGWLISRGEKAYEAALADPESLVELITEADDDGQIEGFEYASLYAWEEVTGQEFEEMPIEEIECAEEPAGEQWEEDELAARFPKLAARFGWE